VANLRHTCYIGNKICQWPNGGSSALYSSHAADDDESWDDRQAVHYLFALTVEAVALTETRMTINVQSDREFDEVDDDICEEVLEPFTFLRHLADVKVTGISDRYPRYVEGQIKRHDSRADERHLETVPSITIFVD
jgi:hypothetical protein